MNKRSSFRLALCIALFLGASITSIGFAETVSSFTKESDGALCQLSGGTKLKLQVCAANIIRVVYTSQATIPAPQGFIVGKTSFTPGTWDATENATSVVVTTPQVTATVSKTTGLVTFATSSGTAVCTESARTLTTVTKGSEAGSSGTLNFNSPETEGVYGLGNLSFGSGGWTESDYWASSTVPPDKTGQINIRNLAVDMHQMNWMDVIPFFITTSGYGVLMNFGCHATKAAPLNFTADFLLNNSWDYFYIYGPKFDAIIAGYRDVTGPAPLLPKWAYGFWQCRNRYESSSELNGIVDTLRSKSIPVDCIVQDWSWWTGTTTGYGSFTWDSPYADPATWIKSLHDKNCHFALSVWGNFSTGTTHYTEMQPHLLTAACNGTATNPGVPMNIFDTTAARLYWGYMNSACFSAGVDAWWMDATEPECNLLTGQSTSYGVIDKLANCYPLAHAKNIYEHQRAVSSAKRVTNLTRSFWGGQQRFGTIYWNGDLSSSDIKNVATTVSGGINSSMAGNPYWSSDIGGFQNTLPDDILIRWFEAGTFSPIFRVHGSRATEIYHMSAAVQPIALAFTNLRYRLMPYIYSLAWKVTSEGYTMTRALWFDFPGDANVINVSDQYMFGPGLLINPVIKTNVTSRNVYLPAGTWYDFWTGTPNTGAAGRTLNSVAAPQSSIPIYAPAGAIIPLGPRIQYATQKQPDTIELRVYPGADGKFTLYEDEGDSYNYETGKYSTIPITYSNSGGGVTIGARTGSFDGMLTNRVFKIVKVSAGHGIADSITSNPDCTINYSGAAVTACGTSVILEGANHPIRKDLHFSFKTAEDRIVFPLAYTNAVKHVGVYDISGRLLQTAVLKNQVISLKKDFGLSGGAFVVKVAVEP